MALSIELSTQQSSCFEPTDILCGVVRLRTPADGEPCEALYITLQGLSKVRLRQTGDDIGNKYEKPSSQGVLIEKSVLLVGATDLQLAGNHCWPFSFELPSYVGRSEGYNSDSSGALFNTTSPWKGTVDAGHHPLPPSMYHFQQTGFNCAVEYVLSARLIRPPYALRSLRHNLTTVETITLRPRPRSQTKTDGQQESVQDIHANFSLKNNKSKLSKILGYSCLRSHHETETTAGGLCLRVSLPTVIHTTDSTPIPISIHATCGASGPHVAEQVHIEKFIVQIAVHTRVRAGAQQEAQTTILSLCERSLNVALQSKESHASGPNIDNPSKSDGGDHLPSPSHRNLDDCMGALIRSALRQHEIVPEFATYNIFRAYSLRLYMRFRARGQTFSFRRKDIPLSIPLTNAWNNQDQTPPYDITVPSSISGSRETISNQVPGSNSVIDFPGAAVERQDCGEEELPAYSRRRRPASL